MLDTLGHDVRFAVRRLRRQPGFALIATLTMALGLGSAITLFAVVDTVILRPLPFADQERLVLIWEKDASNPHIEVSWPNFEDWRREARTFSEMAAMGSTTWGQMEVQRDPPLLLTLSTVSASFFDTLGAHPTIGRTFLAEDDAPSAARVAVLSHATWQQHFGADPAVIGTAIRVGADEESFTIVGVMPPAFGFPSGADVWTPVGRALAGIFRNANMDTDDQRGLGVLYGLGRLAPGVTLDEARAEMDVLIPALWETHFGRNGGRRSVITPLTDFTFGTARTALFSLLGGVMLLLLITCTNVAGLMIVRSQSQRREVAVRCALGITGRRLFRAHLVETMVLAAAAAGAGLAIAYVTLPLLVALGPADLPRLSDATVTGPAVGLAIALAFICASAMALVSAPRMRELSLVLWLRDGAPGATAGRARIGARNALIVAEVAVALVLVAGAGLLERSYLNLTRIDLGFRPANVLTMDIILRDGAYPSLDARRVAYRSLLERLRQLPGVEAAGATFLLPFEYGVVGFDGGVLLEGETRDRPEDAARPLIAVQVASPGYFEAMGITVTAGRVFTDRDTADAPGAVVVSASLARHLWPGVDPIGRRLFAIGVDREADDPTNWRTVVGVAGDVRYREIDLPRFSLYVPFNQVTSDANHLVVRTTGDPAALGAAARREVERTDPNLIVVATSTLDSIVSAVLRPWKFNMTVATVFAVLAVGLAAIGLFGTVAYDVTQRTREIGVRRALGAPRGDLLRLVWGRAVVLTTAGAGLGLLMTIVVSEALRPLLFGVAPRDPVALATCAGGLVLVCSMASLLAAVRAISIDPMVALRSE